MASKEYETLLRRVFEEGINRGNLGVIDELIAPTYVNHNFPGGERGSSGFKQIIAMFRTAFPDLSITVEDVIVEGSKVSSRGVARGTQQDRPGAPEVGGYLGVADVSIDPTVTMHDYLPDFII